MFHVEVYSFAEKCWTEIQASAHCTTDEAAQIAAQEKALLSLMSIKFYIADWLADSAKYPDE
jgi:hypothetical protein